MKKALFAALCCLLVFSACKKNETEVKVTGVSVSPATLSLVEGSSDQLRATVTPSDAANKAVSWTSSADAVATVDNTGKVIAVKAGSATITVKTADGGKTATCAVTVTAKVIPVTGISIGEGATAEVEEGKTVTLTATVQPENATDKTVTWTSSKPEVATVDGGVVTGVAPGEAVITAKAGDKTVTCTVTVVEDPTKVTGVWLDKKAATRYLNGVVELKAHVVPSTAGDKSVSWSSSNEAVATVGENGLVTVLAEGEATITVTTVDGGLTDQCKLTVNPIPDGAVLSVSEFNSSTADEPLLILQQSHGYGDDQCITRSSGTVDFNGHTIRVLNMQNNDSDKVVGLCNGIISQRLNGYYAWGHVGYHGKVMLEEMEVGEEFYTYGHIYIINSGYYECVDSYRTGSALGDVYIYGGHFKAFNHNPDAGDHQGDIYLFGGKFAMDPSSSYVNPTNPRANNNFIIAEGYSVKENTDEDKDEFPYIVSKD